MRADTVLMRSMASLSGLLGWTRNVRMAWSRRKIMGELASLDDYLLRDMGITRQDIASVLADPLHEDPTLGLAARARHARWARRSTAKEERRWASLLKDLGQPSDTDRRAA